MIDDDLHGSPEQVVLETTTDPTKLTSPPRKSLKRSRALTLLITSFAFCVASVLFMVWALNEKSESQTQFEAASSALESKQEREAEASRQARIAEDKRLAAANQAALEAEAKQRERDYMREIGFEDAGNGLYYRFADFDEYTCGMWNCTAVVVATADSSCPNSVYVEANIMLNNVVIGLTNGTLGSLPPNSTGVIILDDHQGMGDFFQLTTINCR